MTVRAPSLSIGHLQDLFYRCKFSQILEELNAYEEEQGGLDVEMTLIKANALFEQHQVADAKAALKDVSARKDSFDAAYLYALARLSYLDDQPTQARALFEEIYGQTADVHYRFKSLLGIANTYFTEQDFAKIPALIETLHAFEPLPKEDERISLMIFLGNYYLASGASAGLAKEYFKKALSHSAANTWTYFVTRSLFGLAQVCEKESQTNELMWTLEVLGSFVNESEQRQFSSWVNHCFKSYMTINTPMEFDTANRRIMLNSRWLPFHDKPLLFQFLLLLHEKSSFVEKESIATHLWPEEGYKPRVHDPRIFDIAKRARNMIEAYENQPVVLLSGRMGYKLASI